jgi:hypothetical protein
MLPVILATFPSSSLGISTALQDSYCCLEEFSPLQDFQPRLLKKSLPLIARFRLQLFERSKPALVRFLRTVTTSRDSSCHSIEDPYRQLLERFTVIDLTMTPLCYDSG